MKIYYYVGLVFAITITSCVSKRDCNIVPISLKVMDTIKFKGDFICKNKKGNVDTLSLIDHYNILSNIEIKSITNHKECEHSIGFDYDSKNGNGTIGISLDKNENKEYFFSVNGFCINKDFSINENQVVKDSLFIVKVDSCENSKFKELAFRKFRLEYFITQNGDIWKPIKFIPRNPR